MPGAVAGREALDRALAQAVATANYIGADEPTSITISRQGEIATIDANVLLKGTVINLEAGDTVEIR